MSRRRWARRPAGVRETAAAAAVGVGVGGVVFWLVRTLLARDRVVGRKDGSDGGATETGEGAGS